MTERLRIEDDTAWIGETPIVWGKIERGDIDEFARRRLLVPFENGLRLSLVWGSMTYSDNYDHPFGKPSLEEEPILVEVGVLGSDGLLRCEGSQAVFSYLPMERVRSLVGIVGSLPSSTTDITGLVPWT